MADHEISTHVKRSFCFSVKCSCGWISREYFMETEAKEEAKNHFFIAKQMHETVEERSING